MRLDFSLRAEAAITLPPFLGSTLRGAFGAALKQVFCFVPHEDTEDCWFREACPYQYIFESKNLGNLPPDELHPKLKGQREFPHPFVLIPSAPVKKRRDQTSEHLSSEKNFNEDYQLNHFSTGETLNFSLLLIGKAVHHWAHVLVAVRLFAANGLGEEYARVPFTLIKAFAHDARGKSIEIFSRENPRLSSHGVAAVKLEQIVNLEIGILQERMRNQNTDCLHVEFLTPTARRILLDGKTAGQLNFTSLIKKITERLEFLACLHAEPSQRIDYRPVLIGAEDIQVTDKSLRFYLYEQRSKRQEKKIPRDVFLGRMSYQRENLEEFLPFLAAGEILNVGADTVAGLGRFVIHI